MRNNVNFKNLFSSIFLIVALVAAASSGASAQEAGVCKTFDSYVQLDAERTSLQKEATEMEGRIKLLKDKISDLESFQIELDDKNKRIDELTNKPNKTDEDNMLLKELANDKNVVEGRIRGINEGKTVAQLKDELKQQIDGYPKKLAELQCINKTLGKWLSPEGNFKFWMSVIFAFLILLVIAGFFWTALKDEKVRQAVFAGQVGLQFIALFSIVIAIILFGITGILEAKELAALLGSLAGYILGRTMSNQRGENQGGAGGDGGGAGGAGGAGGGAGGAGNFALKVKSIKITPAEVTLDTESPEAKLAVILLDDVGKTLTAPAGTPDPKWNSSDKTIVVVDAKGVVRRLKAGTADITAEFGTIKSQKCTVTCI